MGHQCWDQCLSHQCRELWSSQQFWAPHRCKAPQLSSLLALLLCLCPENTFAYPYLSLSVFLSRLFSGLVGNKKKRERERVNETMKEPLVSVVGYLVFIDFSWICKNFKHLGSSTVYWRRPSCCCFVYFLLLLCFYFLSDSLTLVEYGIRIFFLFFQIPFVSCPRFLSTPYNFSNFALTI